MYFLSIIAALSIFSTLPPDSPINDLTVLTLLSWPHANSTALATNSFVTSSSLLKYSTQTCLNSSNVYSLNLRMMNLSASSLGRLSLLAAAKTLVLSYMHACQSPFALITTPVSIKLSSTEMSSLALSLSISSIIR